MCSQNSSGFYSCSFIYSSLILQFRVEKQARFLFLDAVHRSWHYAMSFTLCKLSQKLWYPLITTVWLALAFQSYIVQVQHCQSVVIVIVGGQLLWLILCLLITAATVFRLIFSWSPIFLCPFPSLAILWSLAIRCIVSSGNPFPRGAMMQACR